MSSRAHDPLKFLHTAPGPNELLNLAKTKFKHSRFGNGNAGGTDGPFALGWKSMPRQVFGDFSTGLSDDARTIEHANSVDVGNIWKAARRKVGFHNLDHVPTGDEGDVRR